MWRPTNHKPESIERFRARRVEAGIRVRPLSCALSGQPRLADTSSTAKSEAALGTTLDVASIDRRGRRRSTSARTWAPASTQASSGPCRRCSVRSNAPRQATWLLLENSAGAGGTIGRSIDELATICERLGRHPRLGALPRQLPSVGVGCRRHGSRDRERAPRRGRSEHRHRPAPGPSRERRCRPAGLESRSPCEPRSGSDGRRARWVPRRSATAGTPCNPRDSGPGRARSGRETDRRAPEAPRRSVRRPLSRVPHDSR